jgi:hypothetical protein
MHPPPLLAATSPLPTAGPAFRVLIVFHILSGLTCIVTASVACLARKRPGTHPRWGTVYYRSLAVVFVTATGLSIMRWQEDKLLFVLGSLTFALATLGLIARNRRPDNWPVWHGVGMGGSYITLLSAFLLDNSSFIPLVNLIQPAPVVWSLPSAVGLPLLAAALLRYHRSRGSRGRPARENAG